jgi:osmoprotectant transport system ATP-binding protein
MVRVRERCSRAGGPLALASMIELRSVTKRHHNGVVAVDNLSLEIESGEFCVLVGPSGCGKTTTLKMINRLEEPSSGELLIDGVDITSVDAVELRRGIGYVMQQGGLFPHRRVADNVATVPRLLGWSSDRIAQRVDELLALVGLDPDTYRRRFPHELSGGERQRVGVARALGADPPILLMDEPFGAVDPIARKRLQVEFRALQARLGKTVVFVTHDIEEAIQLGHRIAILETGAHLAQFDTPAAILAKPASPFVAEFVGTDRDIQRLGVTELSLEDVELAPTTFEEATTEAAVAIGRAQGAHYVVLVDGDADPTAVVDTDGCRRPLSATLPVGTSLRSVLAAMLQDDDPIVAVRAHDRVVGVITLEGLHAAMRRSVGTPPPQ